MDYIKDDYHRNDVSNCFKDYSVRTDLVVARKTLNCIGEEFRTARELYGRELNEFGEDKFELMLINEWKRFLAKYIDVNAVYRGELKGISQTYYEMMYAIFPNIQHYSYGGPSDAPFRRDDGSQMKTPQTKPVENSTNTPSRGNIKEPVIMPSQPQRKGHNRNFMRKGRYGGSTTRKITKTKIGISILWLVLSFVIAFFAPFMPTSTTNYLAPLLWLGTFIVGVYFSYRSGMFIDHRISHQNTGLFARRIVSGVLALVGLVFLFLFYFSFSMILFYGGTSYGMFVGNFAILCIGFFLGLIFMGAYIFFTYQRGSGVIIHRGSGW